jgi:hypothetical protein
VTTDDEAVRESVRQVDGDYVDVRLETNWQGKTNGYLRSETTILKIVDAQGQEVTGIWDADWTTCATGIQTRRGDEHQVTQVGRTKFETRLDRCVRIDRAACPVAIQFAATREYADYSDDQYSSRDRSVYWIRYVSDQDDRAR